MVARIIARARTIIKTERILIVQIPGLTQRQIDEMQRVISVLIQKYADCSDQQSEPVLSSLAIVLNDLAQTTPDASQPTTEELIVEFNRQHNRRSYRYSVVVAPAPFDLRSEPINLIHTNKLETAMNDFKQQLSGLSAGWLALISNEDRRIIGEVNL